MTTSFNISILLSVTNKKSSYNKWLTGTNLTFTSLIKKQGGSLLMYWQEKELFCLKHLPRIQNSLWLTQLYRESLSD